MISNKIVMSVVDDSIILSVKCTSLYNDYIKGTLTASINMMSCQKGTSHSRISYEEK